MRLREATPKVLKLLHPTFREFAQKKRRSSKLKLKGSYRNKAVKKSLKYSAPLPRISTFYCETCHFATSVLQFIKYHKCPENKEKQRNYPQENELRAVLSGSRCKIKDSTAVMERCPYPQKMPKLYCPTVNQDIVEKKNTIPAKTYSVPKLSDMCLNILSPNENRVTDCYMEILPSTSQKASSSLSSVGFICNDCLVFSPTYEDYDDHLSTGDCRPKCPYPIPIMTHNSVIPEYAYGRCRLRFASEAPWEATLKDERKTEDNARINGVALAIKRRHNGQICTGCQKKDWCTTEEFHEHILECGRSMYNRNTLLGKTSV